MPGLRLIMRFPKMKLNVEPTFKYMIKPMNKVNDTKPYIIGVSTGVTFSF